MPKPQPGGGICRTRCPCALQPSAVYTGSPLFVPFVVFTWTHGEPQRGARCFRFRADDTSQRLQLDVIQCSNNCCVRVFYLQRAPGCAHLSRAKQVSKAHGCLGSHNVTGSPVAVLITYIYTEYEHTSISRNDSKQNIDAASEIEEEIGPRFPHLAHPAEQLSPSCYRDPA